MLSTCTNIDAVEERLDLAGRPMAVEWEVNVTVTKRFRSAYDAHLWALRFTEEVKTADAEKGES